MHLIKPRNDEGEITVRTFVIDAAGTPLSPTATSAGVEIWADVPPGAVALSVITTPDGSAFRYALSGSGRLSPAQERTAEDTLTSYGLTLWMTAEQQQTYNRLLDNYVF